MTCNTANVPLIWESILDIRLIIIKYDDDDNETTYVLNQ